MTDTKGSAKRFRTFQEDEIEIQKLADISGLSDVDIRTIAMRYGLRKILENGYLPIDLTKGLKPKKTSRKKKSSRFEEDAPEGHAGKSGAL